MVSKKDRINQQWNAAKSDQDSGLFNTHGAERKMLLTSLSDDEPIKAWLPGERVDSEAKGSKKLNGVLVATDRRVLFAKGNIRGGWQVQTETVPMAYQAIEGVHQDTGRGTWTPKTLLRISGSGNTSMEIEIRNSKRAIQDFVDVVNQHIYDVPGPGQVIQAASPMEELQIAAQLLASGALTDAEFQEIKANLLSKT